MESGETYRTVAGDGEAAFEIRGSEFIGYATQVGSVDEAERFLDGIRAAHPDATHHVPAYRVQSESGVVRSWSDDDEEPTGSAGKPALNVLEQRDLENVAVVIVRYYGGTNLGIGGLARAYAKGAKVAIEAAEIVHQRPQAEVTIDVAYDDSGTVRGIIESEGHDFEAEYGETVRFVVSVPQPAVEGFFDRVRSATSDRASIDR